MKIIDTNKKKKRLARVISTILMTALLFELMPYHMMHVQAVEKTEEQETESAAEDTTAVQESKDNSESGKRTVKVGYYIAPGFQDYDETTGAYSGSSYEFLMAIKQYTNWNYEFVPVNFSEGVEMLQNGQIDLMNNVSKTAERETTLGFSAYASGANYGCLIVDASNTTYAYDDYESYGDLKVGMLQKSIFRSYFADFCTEHGISPSISYYENDDAMSQALADGEINARVVSSSYHDGSRMIAKFAPMDYYMAVPKGETELLTELNEAMNSIQMDMPNLKNDLEERYEAKYVEDVVVLSEKEKAYITEHPIVTVAVDDGWYPISYFIDGTYAGPLADIYHQIEQATGITFEFVQCENYEEALESVSTGKTDMIAEFPYDFIYANEWNVSLSDQVADIGMYTVIDEKYYQGSIRKIALFDNPYLNEMIQKMYGDGAEYIMCDSIEEAVQAVLNGTVDCTFMNQYIMSTYQNRGKYISLHYMSVPALQYKFGLGISSDTDVELKSIIGKGLQTLSDEYYSNLFQMTAEMSGVPDVEAQFYQNPIPFVLAIGAGIALIAVLIMFFIYRKRMNKKNRELQHAKQAQSDFLSRMSHDMRTPMNGIMGISYLMEKEPDRDKMKMYIPKLQESSKYLLRLINDVLDMNKIESGSLELNPKPCHSKALMESIIDLMQPIIDEKQIDFRFDFDNIEWHDVILDEQRMKQIIVNLLSNAVKFTPNGGKVELIVQQEMKENRQVSDQFIIRDNGIGISEEFIPHLFDAFAQEQGINAATSNGSGLGLSIVKQLVELMGGTITVNSKKDVGTEFIVDLDFQLAESEPSSDGTEVENGDVAKVDIVKANIEKAEMQKQAQLTGMKVLLCEDHPLNATIATKLLEREGAVVTWAKNGQEGVEAFEAEPSGIFDVILMDIRMPVLDGLQATKAIRSFDRADAAKIPIIAMSANAYEEDVKNSLEAGMNAHLAKPIEPEKMYDTIQTYVKG